MSKPLLSIIMPTYNGEAYVQNALDSILLQNINRSNLIEILIVDDGSTDKTLSIISKYKKKLPITLLRSKRTGSWTKGTNEGLLAAKGEFSCTLHQDDEWHPNRLETVFDYITRFPEIDLFVHNVRYIDDRGGGIGQWTCPFTGKYKEINPNVFFNHLIVQDFICINAPIVRTSLIKKTGGFDENFWYTADWDLWLKLFGNYPSIFINQSLSSFRIHAEAQTVVGSQSETAFRKQLEEVFTKHSKRLNPRSPTDARILKAGKLSNTVNIGLAQALHRHSPRPVLQIIKAAIKLSPRTLAIYLRDSRIHERLGARLRVQHSLRRIK